MSSVSHAHRILILDFGSQYTQLIARALRELGIYCEIHPFDWPSHAITQFAAKGIILSGGPASVTGIDMPRIPDEIFKLNVPLLGICYGMQAMAAQLGGAVQSSAQREFGYAKVRVEKENRLLGQPADLDVWMSHGDHVIKAPAGFDVIASSSNTPIAAFADNTRRYFGVQFHPEVTHTPQGRDMLLRFIRDICQCDCQWTARHIIRDAITSIREQVGSEEVILGLSGGVDSSVAAALLHQAIGDQLTCVFVDTGLLRLNEAQQVMQTFADNMGIRVIKVDAADRFYQALSGITDPEQKRKISGKVFVEIFEQQAAAQKNAKWLAQGTIYPDVIESAATKFNKSEVIKSHHNVGGLPEKMQLKLLEPLRELFKDEVRKLGIELGLPHEMVYRHPFPGPGLVVRILGEVKAEFADVLRRADAIFIEELRRHGLYDKVAQAFAVFLPVKSVGVLGDARCYDYVICLRAVETTDFMTAHWSHLPYEFLGLVSNRIINEVGGISRVTYDISGKPPATIEWE